MRNVTVVFKQDGTIQCHNNPARSLDTDVDALKKLGATEILAQANVPGPLAVPSACDLPTSQVNAFTILTTDWQMILSSFVGPNGFQEWRGADIPTELVVNDTRPVSTGHNVDPSAPVLVKELIGFVLRAYKTGDALTEDFIPHRVNIETNELGNIVRIWFG
ncbi:I78 family peptidase inhibitor [Cerasicoccus frondis]|uniref:I78 family peptidase inhibitor n=1 Tax=Cerasicoccus frondis TaxID=490090 RepID=UPI0028527EF8|nr:I78 family peptidase inhibitor [Cerasicoccus frondis]